MSLSALAPLPTRKTRSVARVIPGMRAARGTSHKKPAISANKNLFVAATRRASSACTKPVQSVLELVAENVLPTASANGDKLRLATEILGDFLIVLLSVFVAHLLAAFVQGPRESVLRVVEYVSADLLRNDFGMTLQYGALTTLLSYSEGLFRCTAELGRSEELKIVCRSVALATVVMTAAILLSGGGTLSSGLLLLTAALVTTGMHARRVWRRRAGDRATAEGKATARNVLIVGTGRPAHEIADTINNHPELGRFVCGFVNEKGRGSDGVLGSIGDLAHIARSHFVDEVIVTIPRDKEIARAAIMQALQNHLDVKIVPDLLGFSPHRSTVECLGGVPTIPLNEEPIPQLGLLLKRLIDLLGTAFALLATAPLMAVIAVAIKVDSEGPVLYRAPRVGKKGRRFVCYKFRTMRTDADLLKESLRAQNEREGPIFKIASDPRVTRVGKLLRRYSLDELPQLWNVWKGDMSLVGPRPHPLDDYQRYELEHLRRLDVTPGITGLWQVTARRNPSFHLNMALDLEYIERWSLTRDLQILWKTFGAVLTGSGA
jgi:exopolysaccharide biosynthesis polyprenyl glycosylphosphotransferase